MGLGVLRAGAGLVSLSVAQASQLQWRARQGGLRARAEEGAVGAAGPAVGVMRASQLQWRARQGSLRAKGAVGAAGPAVGVMWASVGLLRRTRHHAGHGLTGRQTTAPL